VHRDEQRPFIISTPKGSVQVLGTSFEVSAYEKDTFERVTVSTGKVKFAAEAGNEMILVKDQQGVIGKSGFQHMVPVNAAGVLSWKDSKLVFNDDPMNLVAEKIARYYHVQVKLVNPAIGYCHFTGTYDKAHLNEVLDAISKALQLTYKHQGNRVLINGAGCAKPAAQ
jgi:transmembrane sensor